MDLQYIFYKSLKSLSDKWFNAICWRSLWFRIFTIIKKCVIFSLASFGTLKYGYIIKTIEVFTFLPLLNNSVTIGFSLLLIVSAIKS